MVEGSVRLTDLCHSNMRIYHKPARRRILGEIQLLHEELSAALAMRAGQVEAVCNFGWIGQANSYRISNQYRNQQYDLENDVGQDCVDQLILEREDLNLLLTRLATLEQKVRYRVEILEEDNSKEIFIFTSLPLFSCHYSLLPAI